MRGFTFPRLLGVVAVLVVGAVGLVGVSVATAQIADLDPDLCATTYKPSAGAGDRTEADCRTIVAWRNSVVNHPDSVIGATHPMALWGTGSTIKFNTWAGLTVDYVNGERVLTKIELEGRTLAGSLPGELPYLKVLLLKANFLTGELPTWIYSSASLEILHLENNRLSGEVSAFTAPKLAHMFLTSNLFSGNLPVFDLPNMPVLRGVSLGNNYFSGYIPPSWSGFADGRGIQRIDIFKNNISGNVPGWVSNLKFANASVPPWTAFDQNYPHSLSWRDNKLCIPTNFAIPAYKKVNGQAAGVAMYFEPHRCPTSNFVLGKPVDNLKFVPVDVQVDIDGWPTTEPFLVADTVKGLKVTWDGPSVLPAPSIIYNVQSYLSVSAHDNIVSDQGGSIFYRYCPSSSIAAGSQDVGVGYGPIPTTFEVIVTRNNCDSRLDARTIYDPTKYTVDIAMQLFNGATAYVGVSGPQNTWGIYMAGDDQKTYRDVANVANLGIQSNIWLWDATNQVWAERNQQDYASRNLEPGTALAFRNLLPLTWLDRAGLSTADEDTPVQLENGWNVISAGGSASRSTSVNRANSAFFMDSSLWDCGSLQGAIVIMRYDARSESFDVALPCHPSVEADMARDTDIGLINEIEEADTLFIYFRSVLPVTINWHTASSHYIPHTS